MSHILVDHTSVVADCAAAVVSTALRGFLNLFFERICWQLACSRLGAVHSVVFAGFSAEALRDRINDAKVRVVVTADEGLR